MSGALQVDILSEALLSALNNNASEAGDKLIELRNEAGFITQEESVIEAPFITHNLESSIQIDNPDDYSVRVYPDEGIAPYALYVILQGVKRKYAGNPFFERAQPNAMSRIEDEITLFELWACDLTGA